MMAPAAVFSFVNSFKVLQTQRGIDLTRFLRMAVATPCIARTSLPSLIYSHFSPGRKIVIKHSENSIGDGQNKDGGYHRGGSGIPHTFCPSSHLEPLQTAYSGYLNAEHETLDKAFYHIA